MKLTPLILAATAFAATASSASAASRMLDPAIPADAMEINKRVQCGAGEGVPGVFHWSGRAYGRRAGEPDKLLFNLEGMNIRRCITVNDPKKGVGYRLISREVMFYTDVKTGQVLRTFDNPYTGKTVDVMQVANDPVNSRPSFAMTDDGKPVTMNLQRSGDLALLAMEAPLFYTNPLAGDYQDYVGNKYHAMEIFDFTMNAKELLDTRNPTAFPSVAWVRISDWMPWLQMQGREGQMVFNAMGTKVANFDALPAVIKDEIALNYPIWNAPPPADDSRPNATTWTVFKKQIDAKRAAQK